MGTSIVKRIQIIFLSLALCIALLHAVAPVDAKTPVIESISVLVESSEPEQVVFRLSGPHTPKTFRIDGDRPRLVFDFYGINYPEGVKRISDIGGKIISGLRVGMHTDPFKTRVVIDIQKNTPYQYDYSFNVSNRSLVVTLTPDAQDSAARQKPAEGPVHLGYEQLKVEYDTAGELEQVGAAEAAKPEAKAPEQQTDEADQAVVAIAAESMKKVVPSQSAEAGPQNAVPDEPVEGADSDADAESTVSPAAAEEKRPVPADPHVQETAKEVADAPPAEPQPVDPVLLGVSFEKSINNSETVFFRLSHFSPPLVFGIEKGEPRVVCDFMDAGIAADVPALIETNGQFVNRISIARQTDPDKVRVELVLVPNRHYDLQQLFFKEDNLFVVIVKELQK